MDYISQHIQQEYAKEQKEEAWRIYQAENLRLICENTAKYSGGSYISAKWDDIANPKPEETRTPQQVIDHVMSRLKEVGGNGCV